LLPDVSLEKGVLKIAPIEKSTPPEAEALAARLYAMLPRIRITGSEAPSRPRPCENAIADHRRAISCRKQGRNRENASEASSIEQ
jgi:hypothetical protein